MNNGIGGWIQGPDTGDMAWLTDLLEQRAFNNFTAKQLLELFVRLPGVRCVQTYGANRKNQQLVLELTHYSGDMAVENSEIMESALDLAFHRQLAYHGCVQQGMSELGNDLNVDREPALKNSTHLLFPLRINNTCVGVLALVCEVGRVPDLPLHWMKLLVAVFAQCMCSTLLPNFVTLYARPYQRVEEGELGRIQDVLDRCSGNKTMAAKVLNMTPRQLRYRLEKLRA